MLKTRVLTAIVLLPVVLGLLFAGSELAWTAFALLVALLCAWEWSRLCGFSPAAALAYLAAGAALGLALAALWQFDPPRFALAAQALYVLAAAFWIVAVPSWLALKLRPGPLVCGLAGLVVVWPMWAALVELRAVGAKRRVSQVRNEIPTAGHALVNLKLGWQGTQWRVDAGIDNLFDRAHAPPLGGAYLGQGPSMTTAGIAWGVPVAGPGRSFTLALGWEWQ